MRPSWQINNVGGLDDGSVVKDIFLAFLASPTHNADLSVAISGDESESSESCLSTVSLK